MDYVRSLKSIYRIDEHLVGERAVDLAVLVDKGFSVPLCFAVTNEAFERFIVQNKLQAKIGSALLGNDAKTVYDAVRELILQAQMPAEIEHEIIDAYEGLGVDAAASVNAFIKATEPPLVNVILSPNYTLSAESTEGMILGVRGAEQLLLAVKECWACLFTPQMRRHRKEMEIGERNLNTGVIAQRAAPGHASAEAWSASDGNVDEITVKAYYGSLDVSHAIGKDEWRFSREFLKPGYQSVGPQAEMFAHDEEGRLERVPIGERGQRQKLSDKEMIEAARLAKKTSILLERPVKLFFDVEGETVRTLLCNRLILGKRYEAEERIEETVLFQAPRKERHAEPSVAEPAKVDEAVEEPKAEPQEAPRTDEDSSSTPPDEKMADEAGEEKRKIKEEGEGTEPTSSGDDADDFILDGETGTTNDG